MDRRRFIKRSAFGLGVASTAALTTGCRPEQSDGKAPAATSSQKHDWKMVTAWPTNFPIFGTGAARLAEAIQRNSGGRITIRVYGAGELVPAFEAFDAVSRGIAQIGHTSPAYWRGFAPAAQLISSVPFGMTAMQVNAWLHHDDGWDLWREVYAPFGIVPFPAGNTGVQMGGWYKQEIRSISDFQGLKVRVAGLGAEVLKEAGASPVVIPGAELFTAMQTGAIDATEFTGPHNDLAWGLQRVASHYYYPGWHEPAGMLECLVNQAAFELLDDDLQAIVTDACVAENDRTLAEFTARNQRALEQIVTAGDVQLSRFPDEVLLELKRLADLTLERQAAADPLFGKVYASFDRFRKQAIRWQRISEQAYLEIQTRS